MRTNSSTFSVKFYLKKQKVKNGIAPIYARLNVNGKRVNISTKRNIDVKDWDSAKNQAKGSRAEIQSLNKYLTRIKLSLFDYYQDMTLQRKFVSADALKNKFLGIDEHEFTLNKIIEYHNTSLKDKLAWGTLKNYFTTQKYLNRFLNKRFKTSDIYLSQINYQFITDFEYFLRKWEPVDHQKPLGNNGIMKHMERFRKMLNLAIKLEWMAHDPFAKFKPSYDKVDRGYLSDIELGKLEEKEFKIPRLQQVKDLFIFSCYTGLAYIDVIKLKPENIVVGMDGKKWLATSRQKSSVLVKVPLLPKAKILIEKYQTHPKVLNEGSLFPGISNQKLNSYLKEIGDLCGIEKNLTFHLARHTFATTVTLANGVPIESVSKMLGHTKITTTQIYAKVVETKLSEDMGKLEQKLSSNRGNNQAKKVV